MDYLIVTGLVAEVLLLSRLDRRIFGTWFTPFNLLSYPYATVVLVAFFFAPPLDFVSLYAPSVGIWIVGLFLFWWTGALIGWVFLGSSIVHRPLSAEEEWTSKESFPSKLATGLAWGITPLMAYGLYKSLAASGGLFLMFSADFKSAYTYGLSAHAVVLATPLSVLLIGTYKKGRKLQFIIIGVLLVFLFISQVKGTLLVPIIAALIFRAIRANAKLPVKKVIVGIFLSYVLFNAVYLIGYSFADSSILQDPEIYASLARHYFYYLSAGVLAFGQALRTGVGSVGGPWYLMFAPFINVYRALLGSGPLLVAVSPRELGMDTDLSGTADFGSNVYTMFGTLYLYLGPIGAIFVASSAAFLCYGLLVIMIRSRPNVWLLTLYCILGGWLVMGFFEYYFWHLPFLEIIVYCLVLAAISRWVPKRLRSNTHVQPHPKLVPYTS
jgi:oligosaccharide repeat unit polymerase